MKKFTILACILLISLAQPVHVAFAEDEDDSAPAATHAKKTTGPDKVELKPLTLPIITDKGLTQQVSLLVTIEVPNGKGDEVKAMAPALADAYITDLYGALGSGSALLQGGIVNVAAVKEHLVADTTKVLGGADKFNAVYLDVMQQSKR